ncbi:MAG TPA: hypothetical protein DHV85_20865 [Candidatus Accumulibacter sp.]|nr:hypothetical protein [Accumulibacter sp.]
MAELLIRYKDGGGNITDRRISEIEPHEPGYILALCHKRGEDRTFKVSRIVSAIDAATGEVVEDIHSFLGIEPPAKPPAPPPEPIIPADAKEVLRRRGKDKRELFKRFVLGIIEEHAKMKFFAFFGDACFKCGSPGHLVMDHHVPIVLGGRLVPGNLVALCRDCNNRKREQPAERFYSPPELERLRGFLDNQSSLFDFVFDWKAWEADREAYLVSLGIDAALVHEVLNNPDHRFYIPPRYEKEPIGVIITIDEASILDSIKRVLAERFGK